MARLTSAILKQFQIKQSVSNNTKLTWRKYFCLTWFCIFLYVLFEWAFFVTKPSFMNFMDPLNQLSLLFLTNLSFFFPVIPVFIILLLLGKLKGAQKIFQICLQLSNLIPTFFSSITCLLLFDNFTYTVFKFGIVSAHHLIRVVYLIGFLLLTLMIYKEFIAFINFSTAEKHFKNIWILYLLILIPFTTLLFRTNWENLKNRQNIYGNINSSPNIIILGCDGLTAENMSVYGYEKETTPFLKKFAESSLLAENAFTNSAKTTGSIVSILTGKLPLTTRVMYPPDILQEMDEYEHLPGILHDLGYLTIQLGVPHYVDANAENMREGFDIVNGRNISFRSFVRFIGIFDVDNLPYFWNVLIERSTDRLFHIFFLRDMPNPFQIVSLVQEQENDQKKIDNIIQTLNTTSKPVLIHAHLMVTHTPNIGANQQNTQAADASYDDAILMYDQMVEQLVRYLEESGKISNTVLILYSDHDNQWNDINRIPLIIHFPENQYKGRIKTNVQNLDIAPTILSYLGLQIPDWMKGSSLINNTLAFDRPIFATNISAFEIEGEISFLNKMLTPPPFYQFGYVDVLTCQTITRLGLQENEWQQSEISNYVSPCDTDTLPRLSVVQKLILDQLKTNEFDISSIEIQ